MEELPITDYLVEYKTHCFRNMVYILLTVLVATGATGDWSHKWKLPTISVFLQQTRSELYSLKLISWGRFNPTYLHIMSTGQSLSEGVNLTSALSKRFQPYNNQSLSSGPIVALGSSIPSCGRSRCS